MIDPERYIWVRPLHLTYPTGQMGNYTVFKDCHWLANDEGRIAFYRQTHYNFLGTVVAPQCNPNLAVAERVFLITPGATQIVDLPIIFIRQSNEFGCYFTDKDMELFNGTIA